MSSQATARMSPMTNSQKSTSLNCNPRRVGPSYAIHVAAATPLAVPRQLDYPAQSRRRAPLYTVRLSGAQVSVVARVIRQFEGPGEFVTLEREVVLPSTPTVGMRLDLRAEGVEAPIEVIGV